MYPFIAINYFELHLSQKTICLPNNDNIQLIHLRLSTQYQNSAIVDILPSNTFSTCILYMDFIHNTNASEISDVFKRAFSA